jgi:hypothetical protein
MRVGIHEQPDTEQQLFLTVEEAAGVLRIGRSLAYDLARRYEATLGTEGLPNIKLSTGCRRVPTWALIELATTGRTVRLDPDIAP